MPLNLEELKPTKGSMKKTRRVGRGPGSNKGKTAGKGHKGQKSRSGAKAKAGFEGGQTPLYIRVPKKGFSNVNKKTFTVINLDVLEKRYDNDEEVTVSNLLERGIIQKELDGVKLLGDGKISKKLTVKVHAFSKSAKEKIEAAGGQIEVI
ncbi:MAG TPA: 50S ribosomal protein L15 [Thermotogota bacterium]|nr:50S ribosomal protein L15 [Thermotogota bacterium]HPJ88160.1 50S ribosomal protein L15 [Thermotogota bacterium]HPR95593.1 50S ribosomal protein L15 [Thermotogota bacterium]